MKLTKGNSIKLFKLKLHPPNFKPLRLRANPSIIPLVKNTKLIAPGSGGRFPVSVTYVALSASPSTSPNRVSERRFRNSGDQWDKGVHDGASLQHDDGAGSG
jgi:hypothetical protein